MLCSNTVATIGPKMMTICASTAFGPNNRWGGKPCISRTDDCVTCGLHAPTCYVLKIVPLRRQSSAAFTSCNSKTQSAFKPSSYGISMVILGQMPERCFDGSLNEHNIPIFTSMPGPTLHPESHQHMLHPIPWRTGLVRRSGPALLGRFGI